MIDYKNTLNLPCTKFPMRANLAVCESIALERWYKDDLYKMIRCKKNNKNIFVLHDGPPYVNGKIHLGHAVNKVLKDIVIKYKGLMGYNAPYIPGWDCHGLPIELQVERLVGKPGIDINPNEFRSMCRKYALEQIEIQKKDFIRLGVLGDWSCPYLTMNFKTEANIIRTLSEIVFNGYLYKGIKPVHWCFKCCSVLAESEVEYYDHISPSIDVAFSAVDNISISEIFNVNLYKQTIELVIWTTTPWTLPSNQALSVHPDYSYQLISMDDNRYVIIAANLVDIFMKRVKCLSWKILGETLGHFLEFLRFNHPFMPWNVPVVLSDHVSLDSGTGVVHIAPSHGIDDYLVAKKYNFQIIDVINNEGCYMPDTHIMLDGMQVLQSNNIIIDLLRKSNALLYVNFNYKHSYPYCWRHDVPVIFKATSQWFLSMDKHNLRDKLLKIINQVRWIPDKGKYCIETMIANRPDWCLSRQRVWGVPIPLFVHKKTGELHPNTFELMELVAQRVEQHGIQAWWDLRTEDIIGKESDEYEKILDTLDVWFDSGSTHHSVIPKRSEYSSSELSDLFLEGSDQYRGWFMSSLVISTAIKGRAPYKEVLSHGFTVDFQGRKMSKSLGNVISPQEIVNKFGADVLRLWVASSDYSKEMIISDYVLKHITDIYRRIRNTARFCLANISDFNPKFDSVSPEDMIALDCWAIDRTLSVQLEIISDYNEYNFHSVIQRVMKFCSIEMGSFYLDVIKDRQYTTQKNSIARRSCQTTLYHVIESMVRWIAPILSFTADEIWRYIPGNRSKYVFTEEWYDNLFSMDSTQIMNNNYWNNFLDVKNEVNKIIEQARIDKIIGGSLDASVILYATSDLASQLRILDKELSFGLMTSSAIVLDYHEFDITQYKPEGIPGLQIVLERAKGEKCLRCWNYRLDINEHKKYKKICTRCVNNIIGPGENRRFF